MRARQAADLVRQAKNDLLREIEAAEHRSIEFARAEADRLSAGTVTQSQLNKENNPYGHGPMGPKGPRGSMPYGDPAMINQQSGKFRAGWQTLYGQFRGGRLVNSLLNETPEADFLEHGTRLMIKRPLLDLLAQRVAAVRIANLQEAFRRANKP